MSGIITSTMTVTGELWDACEKDMLPDPVWETAEIGSMKLAVRVPGTVFESNLLNVTLVAHYQWHVLAYSYSLLMLDYPNLLQWVHKYLKGDGLTSVPYSVEDELDTTL